MLALVRRARRRILHNLLFSEGANAASAALLVFILLLILGAEVLGWYWVVFLPGAGLAFAIWRIRRRLPSEYVTAQRVDRRLGLADTLSTAQYFLSHEADGRVSAELVDSQRNQADRLAGALDVRKAIPYVLPRTAYITAALFLIGSSLFALRYGVTDRLDLKPPLAAILRQSLGLPEKTQQARLDPRRDPSKLTSDDQVDAEQAQANDAADPNQQPGDAAENDSEPAQKANAKADAKSKNSQADSDTSEDQADASEQPAEPQQNGNPKDGQKDGKPSQSGANSQSQQNNQSLLSKMKEAMQNLMSSMQQSSKDQQQNSSNQNGKNSKGQQNQGKQQAKGEKSKSQSGDSQDQQSADESQEAQNSPGQSSDQQDSALANKQPGSGAGNRDGAKDVHLAEQLAAMGKISEIIGKRAANVTGEATVDVEKTSQQLRTGYQEKRAEHSQTGTEIHRDEIPVALESYVEQYFEQVRKQNPGR